MEPGAKITVTDFEQTSEALTVIHKRLGVVEEGAVVINRIWQFLKWMTPALITAMLAGINHDSLLYRIGQALLTAK